MQKEIIYSGLAADKPGYNCPDGEFDAVMDLWPENGAYRPVLQPQTIMSLSSGQQIVYIHTPKSGTVNYIKRVVASGSPDVFYWTGSETALVTLQSGETYVGVASVGNTLLIYTTANKYHFLWKEDLTPSAGYKALGTHIPELSLSFGLRGTMVYSDADITLTVPDSISDADADFSEDNAAAITSSVMANINKLIADKATNDGKFVFPFLVRWAYRLFDGSLTMHSAPVLMLCNTHCGPEADTNFVSGRTIFYRAAALVHQLDYRCTSGNADRNALSEWSDIIKSVDVFVSAPIWLYDQSGTIKRFIPSSSTAYQPMSICKWTNPKQTYLGLSAQYQLHYVKNMYQRTDGVATGTYFKFELPTKGADYLQNAARDASVFYLLKSINLDNIAVNRTVIDVPSDYLQSLVNREVMTDDYDSHDNITAGAAFVYNQRLNLANITKRPFGGFAQAAQYCFSDGYIYYDGTTRKDDLNSQYITNTFVTISQEGKTYVTHGPAEVMGHNAWLPLFYFYYPNTNVKQICFTYSLGGGNPTQNFLLNPNPHGMLNGSVVSVPLMGETLVTGTIPSETESPVLSLPNKLYTSEVGNPFFFPVSNINTIGTGEIVGISAAAKPLSLGQFGQFPLYAFSTDGIWALSVNDAGGYSAKQPISMEVAKAGTLTQLDNSVAFSTDRGVMLVSGSDVRCITETIDNKADSVFNIVNSLPGCSTLLGQTESARMSSITGFRTFLANARTVYDFVSQRLVIYNPSKTYAYLFAMDRSKQWGMMRSNIVSSVNSYPNAYAMTSDNRLVNLSARNANDGSVFQLICTRPLKLDAPDVLKRVESVIQRGNFAKHSGETNPNPVQCVLYGSRNLANWFPIWSSTDEYLRGMRGTPYKYFRLLLKCWLRDNESISGCTVDFSPELTDITR